ncbi:hypothetical protein JTB14_007703 [Gonioctena quinquepunctata]|nr:hypothetical protein JTB14_007703 [Gonioctena quinquepunctata]
MATRTNGRLSEVLGITAFSEIFIVWRRALQWNSAVADWKSKTRAKAVDIKVNLSKTGGGGQERQLSEIEERLIEDGNIELGSIFRILMTIQLKMQCTNQVIEATVALRKNHQVQHYYEIFPIPNISKVMKFQLPSMTLLHIAMILKCIFPNSVENQ